MNLLRRLRRCPAVTRAHFPGFRCHRRAGHDGRHAATLESGLTWIWR